MSTIVLDYPTHSLSICEAENGFVRATNLVKGQVYKDMISALLKDNASKVFFDFVAEERRILNNFIRSLVGFNNSAENIYSREFPMYVFQDELHYQIFCLTNDVSLHEQEWFKTIFIKSSFLNAISLFKDASSKLIERLYPSYFHIPENLMEVFFKNYYKRKEYYKCAFNDIEVFLKENDIQSLYHFTSPRNITSIKEKGICSLSLLKEMQIDVEFGSSPFSRNIDRHKSLDNFVHLSYEPTNPMSYVALAEGRLSDFVILNVSPEVILFKSTKFSDINAASSHARISDDINFFLNLNFKSFHKKKYTSLSEENKQFFQAEVLVENKIDRSLILNLNSI